MSDNQPPDVKNKKVKLVRLSVGKPETVEKTKKKPLLRVRGAQSRIIFNNT